MPVNDTQPPPQPFQCEICKKRFTRHENLKRHSNIHSQNEPDNAFPCDYCPTTFSRQDLRRRHVKNKHPGLADPPGPSKITRKSTAARPIATRGIHPSKSPEDAFMSIDFSTSNGSWDSASYGLSTSAHSSSTMDSVMLHNNAMSIPSSSHTSNSTQNMFNTSRLMDVEDNNYDTTETGIWGSLSSSVGQNRISLTRQNTAQQFHRPRSTSPQNSQSSGQDWSPSHTQTIKGVHLFFASASQYLPFIHGPTFSVEESADYILLALCAIGYQFGEDPDEADTEGSGRELSLSCFGLAKLLVAENENTGADSSHKLGIVQTYLLLQWYDMMFMESGNGGLCNLSSYARMISLSRSSGLMQPLPSDPKNTQDLDTLWKGFVKTESHKRTMFALHHLDSLHYQFLSVPRLISHLEIKHDMPCSDATWAISSSAAWAHQTLISNSSTTPPLRYLEAIRRCLYPVPDADAMLHLESQGALNVIHFLQASLREVSGWSTMTGRISNERYEACKMSLSAMEPFIRPWSRSTPTIQWLAVEATWEMAMLETLSWSPSHMGGVVEVSLDAALATSTCLATSRDYTLDTETAKSLNIHVDWFLRYLDRTTNPELEPPYVTVYAFKAFLIAYQLLRAELPNAMTAVGIQDGDAESAIEWAMAVFRKRRKWKIGKLVLQNLVSLAELSGSL